MIKFIFCSIIEQYNNYLTTRKSGLSLVSLKDLTANPMDLTDNACRGVDAIYFNDMIQ